MNKKAFTLVELIVVITILAVLATGAFVSFQGYGQSARDSTRLLDIKNMERILDLYKLTNNKYPTPVNPTSVTYSGSVAWIQGVYGQTAYTSKSSISNVPLDPLTSLEYPYSITANAQEYQLAGVLEGPTTLKITSSTYAGTHEAQIYVKGNYNGQFLKVKRGTTTYLLGVPSILTSDIVSSQLLEDILTNNRLVYNGHKNLPSSFSGSVYKTDGGFDFGGAPYVASDMILFVGDIEDLETDQAERVTFFDKLQASYSGSVISNQEGISELLRVDSSSSSASSNYVAIALNNSLKTTIPVVEASTTVRVSEPSFISQWNVSIDAGVSGFNNLKLPLQSDGIYNFTVDWGDSTNDTITTWDQSEVTHAYGAGGTYTVTIVGEIDGFAFNYSSDLFGNDFDDGDKLIDILEWGNLKLSDGGFQFKGISNLVSWSATDTLDTAHITDMSNMFADAELFNQALNFDTSNVTNMNQMFAHAVSFNQPVTFDTSNVLNMQSMFLSAEVFNQPVNFDTSSVTNMLQLFASAEAFNQPVNFDTSGVTDMQGMFQGSSAFNQPINFDTGNVTSMINMFSQSTLFNQGLTDWCVTNIASEPSSFSTSSALSSGNKPVWGTCPVVNAVCGSDNGGSLGNIPQNRCTNGASTIVIDNGVGSTYNWTCNGFNGGTSVACSASNSG